ncbi:uncharacterized protein NMK_2398 [Novimethylophilus kurashikiensis]|uniref:Uncharacterized protein n=1 Tax=Novimethylophilus kurashikiensis TaxID=1825523 RepID=A0A2R5F9C2_9PROT|nr:hypothetical protein [Novimethylophilus kurashikiensis]GBG14797.1 uncharacterized protein NMK_2398 [Novimethylophilus kurashikiensis]
MSLQSALLKRGAQDLFELLERNFIEKKPLLEGAKIYRGTSTPIQEGGVISDTVMHAALTPRVASMYTHNGVAGKVGYVGEYAIDRSARFYPDYGMEKAMNGHGGGRSIEEAEALLRPKVAELAGTQDERARNNIRMEIDNLIKKELHETALPLDKARAAENMYYYTGSQHAFSNKQALQDLQLITEHNSRIAKEEIFNNYRGPVAQKFLNIMENDATRASLKSPEDFHTMKSAISRLSHISQNEYQKELRAAYGNHSLDGLKKAVVEHPVSKHNKQIEGLGTIITDMVKSGKPHDRELALETAKAISSLPKEATLKDVSSAMFDTAKTVKARQAGEVAHDLPHAAPSRGGETVKATQQHAQTTSQPSRSMGMER